MPLRLNACTSVAMVSTIFVLSASVMTIPFCRIAFKTSLADDSAE